MIYYQVKPQCGDNLIRFSGYMQTVANELFTPAEYKRYSIPDKYGYCIRPEWVQQVTAPRTQSYFFFGARFNSMLRGFCS